jgi:hypothetical protein
MAWYIDQRRTPLRSFFFSEAPDLLLLLVSVVAIGHGRVVSAQEQAVITFSVRDEADAPLPCRVHLASARGEPQRLSDYPFWHDHMVCLGELVGDITPGDYRWTVERGPEFNRASDRVTVVAGQLTKVAVSLKRISHLRSEGWYSGDLHIHRPVAQIESLMQAEDLDFAPVTTWWNTTARADSPIGQTEFRWEHRIYTTMAGEDEREGGALLYFGLPKPLDLSVKSREVPSPMHFVELARTVNERVWIDIEKPFWWDVPAWLATGQMNSIGLANNHMCRSQMLANEAWGKPRDAVRLPSPRGNGRWSQEIYYHILNSGLRLPPSAGSASGVLANPVGYNRVYVHLDQPFTRDAWFASLSRGRCFVTNGPLLRVRVDGELPGQTLKIGAETPRQVELSIQLTSNDPVPELEIIYNGRVVQRVTCSGSTNQQHSVALLLDEPGWFLVRAITDVKETFRFASTAPWYIESDKVSRRISRRAAQFFGDWVEERIARVKSNVTDPDELQEVLSWHLKAREFWRNQIAAANVE